MKFNIGWWICFLGQFSYSNEENVVVSNNEIEVGVNDECMSEGNEIVPTVGMKFRDHSKIFEFYKTYAYSVSFPIRKRSSRKGNDGLLKYVTFIYSREGWRSSATSSYLKPQATIQTRCLAKPAAITDVTRT